jgi:hypothetical protein
MTLLLNGTTGVADVDGSASTPAIRGTDTNTGIFFPAADTIAFAEGGAEVMRIDSSGNVGIGTSSPVARLEVKPTADSFFTGGLRVSRHDNTTQYGAITNNGALNITCVETSIGVPSIRFNTSTDGTNVTERMRIDSSGNLLVGTTSVFGGAPFCVKGPVNANQQVVALWNPATSGTRYFMSFATEGGVTERGYITYNGTSVAISQASDERLKENIVEAPSALPRIEAMKIRSFDFKEDGRHVDYGVIAQELHSIIPAAVFEGSDNEDGTINKPWSVGLEPVIPVLIKAIQEQQAIITDLKSRIEALEQA